MIQALNDLVLESLVSFAFVRFPRLYLALFGVFSSQCIFVFFLRYMLACYPFELSRHMAGIIIGSSVPPHCQLSNQVESLLFR